MAIVFVEGKAGAGKTTYCFDKIKENMEMGVKSVLVVPEQVSLSFEKMAVDKLGFLGQTADVLSFNRLFHRLYNDDREYVSKVGKTILMNRAISSCASKLSVYKNCAKIRDFSGQMLKMITELKRHSVSIKELLDVCDNIEQANVKAKIKDICIIYEKYNELVEERGADSDENLSLLSTLVEKSEKVRETEFFIDSFSAFTGEELKVVSALARCAKNVYVTLKKGEGYIFEGIERTKNKIGEFAPFETVVLKENKKHKGELLHLMENFPVIVPKVYEENVENIKIFYSENPVSECENLMLDITKKVRDGGYKFKDIGVLASNLQGYSASLKEGFERYSINGYVSEKKSLLAHPAGNFVLSFLELFIKKFDTVSVMKFLKSGLTPITFDEVCILENYVLDVNIKGKLWFEEFSFKEADYNLEKINQIREKFVALTEDFNETFKGRHTAGDYVEAIKLFMEKTDLKGSIDKLTYSYTKGGRPEVALEYRQVFNSIVSALNQFELCLGDEIFGTEKFHDMLLNAFNETKISTYPPESDMVICGDSDSLRNNQFKVLYILGANTGSFPAPVTSAGIIKDNERRILEKNNIILAPDGRRKALEQPYKIYELLGIPSETLVLSYSIAEMSGEGIAPSAVISDIKKMFKNVEEKSFAPIDDIDYICTPVSSVRYASGKDSPVFDSAKKWYFENEKASYKFRKVLKARYFKVSASTNENSATLLWQGRLMLSISKLEAFAKCPFAFFLQYGLKLKERNVYDFNIMDRGTLTHSFMEEFTNYVIDNNIDWYKITKDDIDDIFEKMEKKGIRDLTEKMPCVTSRHQFLTEKLTQTAKNALSAVVHQVQAGSFVPFTTELDLSSDERVTPIKLKTPSGLEITLSGKIDRVDRFENEYRIVDYKSSAKELKINEVYNGTMLQLFVYSNALKEFFGQSKGMFYFGVVPDISEVTSMDQETSINMKKYVLNGYLVGDNDVYEQMDKSFKNSSDVFVKRKLLFTEYEALSKKVFEHIENYSEKISKGCFDITPVLSDETDGCAYCSFKSVCGFDTSVGKHRELEKITATDVLKKLREEEENG